MTVMALEKVIGQQVLDPAAPIGFMGVGGAGSEAVLLAERLGRRVDRLVLVAVPATDNPLERHLAEAVMPASARTPRSSTMPATADVWTAR